MAKLFYDTINGGDTLAQYDDAQQVQKTDLEEARSDLDNLRSPANGGPCPDSIRDDFARNGLVIGNGLIIIPPFTNPDPEQPGLTPLQLFDNFVEDERDRVRDILDYFDYEKGPAPIGNVVDGDWFLPEALETPLPDDNGVDVVANAIDAVGGGTPDPNDPLNTTYWQSEVSGDRILIVRLRDYTKRVEGIRLRTNSGDTRAQLQNLDVHAANALPNIDDPENIEVTGENLDDTNPWYEINFVKARCRYIKLICRGSNHTNPDIVRIRSLQVRVGVTNHDK